MRALNQCYNNTATLQHPPSLHKGQYIRCSSLRVLQEIRQGALDGVEETVKDHIINIIQIVAPVVTILRGFEEPQVTRYDLLDLVTVGTDQVVPGFESGCSVLQIMLNIQCFYYNMFW